MLLGGWAVIGMVQFGRDISDVAADDFVMKILGLCHLVLSKQIWR